MKKIKCFYHGVPYDGLVYLECIPKALYYRQAVQKKYLLRFNPINLKKIKFLLLRCESKIDK